MLRSALLVYFLLWRQDSVWSVRLVELRVPSYEREGGRTLLGCQYDMEGERLYSVKWYKDDKEFFRYVPNSYPQKISFERPGVYVNVTQSSNTRVALVNLTRESEGNYSCEVSGESPSFNTTKSHKMMAIHLLPESGPYVTGIKDSYSLDETADINCLSSASRPRTELMWLLNGEPVSQSYLQGPWYRVPAERLDAIETILQLKFIVAPQHFVDGAMRFKCQATIAPLYQQETEFMRDIRLPELMLEKHDLPVLALFNHASDTSASKHSSVILFLFFAFILQYLAN